MALLLLVLILWSPTDRAIASARTSAPPPADLTSAATPASKCLAKGGAKHTTWIETEACANVTPTVRRTATVAVRRHHASPMFANKCQQTVQTSMN